MLFNVSFSISPSDEELAKAIAELYDVPVEKVMIREDEDDWSNISNDVPALCDITRINEGEFPLWINNLSHYKHRYESSKEVVIEIAAKLCGILGCRALSPCDDEYGGDPRKYYEVDGQGRKRVVNVNSSLADDMIMVIKDDE